MLGILLLLRDYAGGFFDDAVRLGPSMIFFFFLVFWNRATCKS